MHIITFIVVLLLSLGALYLGGRVLVFTLIALADVFQHLGFFLWSHFAAPAMRSVQTVIKARYAEVVPTKAVVEPEVTQVHAIAKQTPDWRYLETPTYLRKGKDLVW